MRIQKTSLFVRNIVSMILLLAVFLSTFGASGLQPARASGMLSANTLADGQFVYGPNVGDFNVNSYLKVNAPHLLKYADDLYGRAEYFSINPKVLLALLEVHSHAISNPDPALMDDALGLKNADFIAQVETLSNKMNAAYYWHLYSASALPVEQRNLPSFITPSGVIIAVSPETNAATYALIAGLAAMDQPDLSGILDNTQPDGFFQTYQRLFENDNPLDEKNHIAGPIELSGLAAPDGLLQLPFLRGLSWKFGGVHDTGGGGGVGSPYSDASSMDFYPNGSAWGIDTSSMWVVASAGGTATKISNCYVKILHSDGWETTYYHLENVQAFSNPVHQNDKIAVIANTLAEATCSGGFATGPHVHFTLKHNGALVAINGTPLSGWYVHTGRWNYDTDPNYMWLERAGVKKFPLTTPCSVKPPRSRQLSFRLCAAWQPRICPAWILLLPSPQW